ncbi:MAG: hypothetical protein LAQ69_35905, partial [Acidobacteriia bacterium]|nr:hypothetical protein [Terriglobia bacterium]
MMRRLLGNKFAFATTLLAFASAYGWSFQQGSGLLITGHNLATTPLNIAHGPSIPPDPWAGGNATTLIAHGPSIPPDPWAGGNATTLIAHGPSIPPDPWAGGNATTLIA